MPTISQLPTAIALTAADEIPISQSGVARAVPVGTLLASAQPVITVASPGLLGRASLGAGGPEPIGLGVGVAMSSATLVANGLDHATFPTATTLSATSDLVISDQGNPLLMPASMLRDLFSAGQNIAIDQNGVISATASPAISGSTVAIASLPLVTALNTQDLVAVSQSGSNTAISYANFLDGVTIDKAQPAAAVGDTDTLWVAQGTNNMTSQTFSAIWVWIATKLPTYKRSVVELTGNTNLDATIHNGRLLICSQPLTLTPLTTNMGSGFQSTIINASTGNVTLGSGFVSSTGGLQLAPWQSAVLTCVSFSGGTIAYAMMPTTVTAASAPGPISGLIASTVTTTAVTLTWQPPSSGGTVALYIVQWRVTGAVAWASPASVTNATSFQISGLQASTNYDVIVSAQNAAGTSAASPILSVVTPSAVQITVPAQVTGVTTSTVTSGTVQLAWTPETGSNAATSYTVQYNVAGSATVSAITGITTAGTNVSGLLASTTYDFVVIGVNGAGQGSASATVTATTSMAAQAVTSITWNLLPSGSITHGSGVIGVNAHINPSSAPVQFGFSTSATTPPTNWTVGSYVNTDLWGAYVPTPATAGNWYVWGEGLDGSAVTVSATPFVVS